MADKVAKEPVLVWLDLEMTGLDPDSCAIVQLAMLLTDRQLKPLAKPLDVTIWQPESVLERMEPFVRKMHEDSGLLEAVRSSKISVAQAEQKVMELLTQHCSYGGGYLCGNSIGQDRRFLTAYMPSFESYLHYRQVDVSSVKELAKWWFGVKFEKSDEGKHTAIFDIQQSLAELQFYRDKVFR